MRNAQLTTHRNAVNAANHLERFSQMNAAERAVYRATLSPATNKVVACLNRIAILGFVFGVIFLCWFVGSNLLANG
jgi:hypothetical protein